MNKSAISNPHGLRLLERPEIQPAAAQLAGNVRYFPGCEPGATDSSAPAPVGRPPESARHLHHSLRKGEWGMATAEYAIATLAAVGFAGLLVVILRSDEVRGFLMNIIRNALSMGQ